MKISNQFREKYYSIFVEKATKILWATLRVTKPEAEDLARDFTVSFLYSNSLQKTYDSSKGDVEAFFGSWVRKSVMSYKRKEYQWSNFVLLEEWMKGSDEQFTYEFVDWYYSILEVIKGKCWVSGRISIPYSRVFKASTIQVLQNELYAGEIHYTNLAKALGVKFTDAKAAFNSMRELLDGRKIKGLI